MRPSRTGSGTRYPWKSDKDNGRDNGIRSIDIGGPSEGARVRERGSMLGFIEDCLQNIGRFFSGMDSMPVVMGSAGFQPGGLLMVAVKSKTAVWYSGGGISNRAIPALGLNSTPQDPRHQPHIVL